MERKNLQMGDRIYVQYLNEVVKSGFYLGKGALPWDKDREGIYITYDAFQNIVDWIDLNFIKVLEITIPKNILELVIGKSEKQNPCEAGKT